MFKFHVFVIKIKDPFGQRSEKLEGQKAGKGQKIGKIENIYGMFDNCLFLLFFVFKNNFLFLRLKNLFGNPKETENKNCSQNSSQ